MKLCSIKLPNAMCFINHKSSDMAISIQCVHNSLKLWRSEQFFGRNVNQFDTWWRFHKSIIYFFGIFVRLLTRQISCLNAKCSQFVDLINYWRFQRTDDNRNRISQRGGKLKAQRFSRASGHQNETIKVQQRRVHHFKLIALKCLQFEDIF